MANAEFPKRGSRSAATADAAMAAGILALGVFLAGTGSSIVRRWQSSSARHQSLGFEDQLGMVANTAGLIVIVWWALSLVIAVAAALLERCGKSRAASAAAKFTPAFMRRLALATVGLQLLAASLATASTPPDRPGTASAAPEASAAWTPTPVPAASGAPPPAVDSGSGSAPAHSAATPAVADPHWRPLGPVVEPGPLAGRPLRHQQPGGQAPEVTVRPGDSLWSLSAARLGRYASDVDIALDWPRIYQANRDVIGGNPHLPRPGQVLRLPPGP
ncbi:LysM peptidoglycan-binding domain-containing protein [Arthrobacter sp. U41]|uniref:LysM peptidoglycan-binding domain-containing protein n=1 Tax=Arthrobacter sp. U41 TaxID=1849032 RepID=UPI0008596243|nr:LysM peptidoglycan-binding domain-containing protein [Arthrobacter sp. U41]AOT05174.1 hypothetical protein ASPU41_19500 [Arthrobacter sp. U41]